MVPVQSVPPDEVFFDLVIGPLEGTGQFAEEGVRPVGDTVIPIHPLSHPVYGNPFAIPNMNIGDGVKLLNR